MSIDNSKTLSHESYGTVVVSRMQSGGKHALFGSSVEHSNTIILEIRTATMERHLSTNFLHPGRKLIEVELSHSQWAELVSSIGVGEGTPCTIRYVNGKQVEDCPYISVREQFDEEFDDSVQGSLKELRTAVAACEKLLEKKSVTKADREEILSLVRKAYSEVSNAVPFIKKQFTEQMDNTVKEARGEIEAFAMDHALATAFGEENATTIDSAIDNVVLIDDTDGPHEQV